MEDLSRWFLENGMLLNPTTTEAVLFGTRAQREKVYTTNGITAAGSTVQFSDSVKLLGVTLDSNLSLDRHTTELVRSCSYHTRALRHIRPLLSFDAAKLVAHCIVGAQLDYCNALFLGCRLRIWTDCWLHKTIARVVCQALARSSASELRSDLHWLPIRQRVVY